MTYHFKGNDHHTLGVEIELQLVDRESRRLVSRSEEILGQVPAEHRSFLKPEFMQSYCEICTDVCETVEDVERDLTSTPAMAARADR